ncbi:MAG TPA: hypothetical protein VJO35_15175 [Terriglobales bacterium]|nr:hypothetical protein [Terriglobales bacterium]
MRLRAEQLLHTWLILAALPICAQQSRPSDSLSLPPSDLPKPLLWEPYHLQLPASGGTEPYHWRVIDSTLPRGISLSDRGDLMGVLTDPGPFQFNLLVRDNSRPPKEQKHMYVLRADVPLTVDWKDRARVNGRRIDGSITVSNHTGRDFDLTFIVLAINNIGRATAIGYQHFPLPKGTRDMELPFGDTLSSGNYDVNVDVVGEEPLSKRIFRARLVSDRKSIASGP